MRDTVVWSLRLAAFLLVVSLAFQGMARLLDRWPAEPTADPCPGGSDGR